MYARAHTHTHTHTHTHMSARLGTGEEAQYSAAQHSAAHTRTFAGFVKLGLPLAKALHLRSVASRPNLFRRVDTCGRRSRCRGSQSRGAAQLVV